MMTMNQNRNHNLHSSVRQRIAWQPVGLSSCGLMLEVLQRRQLLLTQKLLPIAANIGKARSTGFYVPLHLSWLALFHPTQLGNAHYVLPNRATLSHATLPSAINLNILFKRNVQVKHLILQSFTPARSEFERHLNDYGEASLRQALYSTLQLQYQRKLHSAIDGKPTGTPKRQTLHIGIVNKYRKSALESDMTTNAAGLIKTQQHDLLKPHAWLLGTRQSPRREIPASQYQTANAPALDPVFVSSKTYFRQSLNTPAYQNKPANQSLPVKSQETDMVGRLFDLGMESMPLQKFSLREVSSPKDMIANNDREQIEAVSLASSATKVTTTNKALLLDKSEITQIADKVSRLLQQRERFERERKGYF